LVLIYGLACLVISFGGSQLRSLGNHPFIYFLIAFPCLILICFAWLVRNHHWKLYGLSEFKDQKDFITLASAPRDLPKHSTGVALSDASQVSELSVDLAQRVETKYTEFLHSRYYLLHAAETIQLSVSPGSGLYRARVWIEAEADIKLNAVVAVTYRVWDDFPQKQITTSDRGDQFAIWLSVNGEFPILAHIQLENQREIWQWRYLDLPGRPRDA
jgi:hypothetical protein